MIKDLEELVREAVEEVFSTMLMIETSCDPSCTDLSDLLPNVVGSVGFIGEVTGVFYLYTNDKFAQKMTSNLLGLEMEEIDMEEMVNDAVGEITNMIVGVVKSRLADRGTKCVLTIPSIVRGNNFRIEPVSSTERRVIPFQCEGKNRMVIEILTKPLDLEE